MEMWKGIFVLFFFVSTTYTFQCDSLYSGRRCGEYDAASKSLKKVVEVTDDVISDAYKYIGSETAELYRTVFPTLNNATIVVQGNMTVDEAIALVNKLMIMLKELQEMTLVGSGELEKINQLITDALKSSLKPHPNAYLILDKIDIDAIKDAVRNSLSGVNAIVRTLVVKAIERAHGHLQTVGSIIEPILNRFGYGDVYQSIKVKVQEIIQRAKDRANGGVYAIENQIQTADNDINTFLTGLDKQAPIVKRGIKDLWSKVEEALDKLGDNVKQQTKDLVEKYKPKVIDSLNRIKTVIIDGAKKIIIELQGDIVKILTEDKSVSKRSITDIWGKIKEAAKNLGTNIKDAVNKVVDEHKPKVIEALKTVQKVVIDGAKKIVISISNGVVKIVTEGQTGTSEGASLYLDDEVHTAYVVIDNSASTYGIRDVWTKVKQSVTDLGDNLSAKAKALIEKYKPKIVNSLNKVRQFVIDEGQKIILEIQGDIVRIIQSATDNLGEKSVEKRSFSDIWGKVKEAAKNLGSNIKDTVDGVLEQYKPKVINALNNVKKVVINGAKQIVIEINNGIVKIVTEGQTASSDGAAFYYLDDDVHHDIYVEIDDASPAAYGIADAWTQVKSAVSDLGDNIKDRVMKIIEEHKPKVVEALNNFQRVIIDAGKKIIIEVNGAIVKVIVDGLEGLSA